LERTYGHRKDGFELLAAETLDRLTLPVSQWLPGRFLDSDMWPVPAQRVERRPMALRMTTRRTRLICR
jgi:hypothetical protein